MGDNILIVHGGGPTSVINASLYGAVKEAKKYKEIDHIYAARNGTGGLMREELIELEKVPDEKLELLLNTPGSAIGTSRDQIEQAEYDRMIEVLLKKNIKYVLFNGGNGSMDTCGKLYKNCQARGLDIRVMGIPKTHDNDIAITDHSPGYGSIARYMAQSVKEVAADVKGLPIHVVVVEALGRNAGWTTAASALADDGDGVGPDLIYLPEVPFDTDDFLLDVKRMLFERNNVIIAVSEGIRDASGNYISASEKSVDTFGHSQLSGAGKTLEFLVKEKLGVKVRSIEVNVLQRCAAHLASKTDLMESVELGKKAVALSEEGVTASMVIMNRVSDDPYTIEYGYAEIKNIANEARSVPAEWINAAGNDVTQEFIDYLTPLIQGESNVTYENGLPVYMDVSHLTKHQ